MAVKIYTRTGDTGKTSLFGGKRVSKDVLRVESYGMVDELNSTIGVVLAHMQQMNEKLQKKTKIVQDELLVIQRDLLTIGSTLATSSSISRQDIRVLGKRVKEFENLIDVLTDQLPVLRNFILPGGSVVGSQLHVSRTTARRAERRILTLSKKEIIDKDILMYFNRLSDLLFTMARFVNKEEKQEEQIWKK